MNFYSDDIINNIIDNEPIEDIVDKIDKFYDDTESVMFYYSFRSISMMYTERLLRHNKTKFAFYCMDTEFNIANCPSCLIYYKHLDKTKNEVEYYILMICTMPRFKKFGYASKLLNDFIERVKSENAKHLNRKIKIIVSSLETAVTYYEKYGFYWTKKSMLEYPVLLLFEKYEEEKENFILELIIK
jgi:ribosomal protein S18 acetylase RimI-like enzyme